MVRHPQIRSLCTSALNIFDYRVSPHANSSAKVVLNLSTASSTKSPWYCTVHCIHMPGLQLPGPRLPIPMMLRLSTKNHKMTKSAAASMQWQRESTEGTGRTTAAQRRTLVHTVARSTARSSHHNTPTKVPRALLAPAHSSTSHDPNNVTVHSALLAPAHSRSHDPNNVTDTTVVPPKNAVRST